MTTFFDRDAVNSTHAVLFQKPKQEEKTYYYDLDAQKWRIIGIWTRCIRRNI